jgi:hypothetical protein
MLLSRTGALGALSDVAMSWPALSIRGVAAQVLGLVAGSATGRTLLGQLGWECSEDDALASVAGLVAPRDRSQRLEDSGPDARLLLREATNSCIAPAGGEGAVSGSAEAGVACGAWQLDPANTVGLATVPCVGLQGKPPSTAAEDAAATRANEVLVAAAADGEARGNRVDALTTALASAEVRPAADAVLGHISNLCNNVTQRGALTRLRAIKALAPALFTHPGMLGEAFALLGGHVMRTGARRFVLCELFGVAPWNREVDMLANRGSEYARSEKEGGADAASNAMRASLTVMSSGGLTK